MNELQALIDALGELGENPTPEQVTEAIAAFEATDLEAARAQAAERAELLLADDPTDEVLAELEQLDVVVAFVDVRLAELAEDAEARAARAAELAERIRGAQPDPDEPEASDTGGDGDEGGTGDGEGEGSEGGTGDGGGEGTEGGSDADAEAPERVAAAARPRLGRVAARRPASVVPRPGTPSPLSRDISEWGLTASANAPEVTAGAQIRTYDQLAQAFLSAFNATKGYTHGPRVKVTVARAGNDDPARLYGRDRTLGMDPGENHRRIEAVAGEMAVHHAGFESVQAAGGICAPVPVRYDLPIVGSDERPVRDSALVRFGADRGGVRVIPPPLIEDLDGAVDVWTETNDVTPSDPVTKPCLTLTCPDDDETLVEAITRCLQVGNFRARYFPEQVEAWMRLAAVNHARVAENRLLTSMGTASTLVTTGQILGTVADVLAALDRAIAIIKSVNRISASFPMRFAFPFWLYNQMRTDVARRLPYGTVDEQYAIADEQINRWFASRRVSPTPFLDGISGQIFSRQGDGPMNGWPSTVVTYLYPEGSHLFLDGGTLDLGLVRDSTLNSTNDLQLFAETFEGHVFHGVESWRLTMDTCPDGSVSAAIDIAPCAVGS